MVLRATIARNEKGELGIIVDTFGGIAVGFYLPDVRRRWSSQRPEVLGTVLEWIRSRKELADWVRDR